MIGTGPFRLKSGTPNRRVELFASRGTGAAPRRSPGWCSRRTKARRRRCSRCVRVRSTLRSSRRRRHSGTTVASRSLPRRRPRPNVRYAGRPRPVQGREGATRGCAVAQPPDLIRRVSSGRARSATTRRSGRSFRRPTRRSSSAGRISNSREPAAGGRAGEPQVHAHDVERDRPSRLRADDSGRRPSGGYRRLTRGAVEAEYYGGGADYYATTPWINRPVTSTEYGARGVPNTCTSPPRTVGRDLECRRTTRTLRSTRRRGVSRSLPTSQGSGTRRRRWRASCAYTV